MARYFIEVSYQGTRYSGFQVQQNANTIQAEVEKALYTILRVTVRLTGSSRTDAGVHAQQNFFHFNFEGALTNQTVYKLNALLPPDIAAKNIFLMPNDAHSRFAATSREYLYYIYRKKNPFFRETAFYYPYQLNIEVLHKSASVIKEQTNFFAFAKTNTQVSNFNCVISVSEWTEEGDLLIYKVAANRFLRGMVRLLTATQLKLARGGITEVKFLKLFHEENKCSFSVPPTGLFLKAVQYPEAYFP